MSKKSKNTTSRRKLTSNEIENIIDFVIPSSMIPKETADSVVKNTVVSLRKQLSTIEIYPQLIPSLKKEIYTMLGETLINPGECVGIITAQSIGEKQTQSNLNTFHKAGSADKQPTVSKFSELLNATNKPKSPSYFIYFNEGNDSIQSLRSTIGSTIVNLTLKKVSKEVFIFIDKEPEPWYEIYDLLEGLPNYTDCVSIKVNMDILYENQLTLQQIARVITEEYHDLHCVYSPDCYAQLDIFVDTSNIELPEEKVIFVTEDNMREIYLEEVVQPIIENISICGVPGINNIFFVQNGNEWFLETENAREKPFENKFKTNKDKLADSTKRFKMLLAHPKVDMTRTISNNLWDIYHTLGIEAVRQYMIDQFSEIMTGINTCHVMLLVDKMTFTGTVCSISRYSMRGEDGGVLGKASFEETLDNFTKAGVHGQDEPTTGISASIICGKRAPIGTGMCELEIDMDKLY